MSDAHGPIRDLDLGDVEAGLSDGSILLVDVREPEEHAGGMIPGSVAMPLSQFDPSALPSAPGKRVVFSCAAGIRSRGAIALSRAAGLDLSEHFVDGYKGWVGAGLPVVPPGG